jgi:hypothetical protein
MKEARGLRLRAVRRPRHRPDQAIFGKDAQDFAIQFSRKLP